jgi:hypothetical protein
MVCGGRFSSERDRGLDLWRGIGHSFVVRERLWWNWQTRYFEVVVG